ncbi:MULTISPECIES: precorrin-6y C5,15-methyltransferase (decarboxylating) subunit CbiE [Psychrilyobacter]|uniref:Precorrin-6y C5,15-methyltransferase (Decarboxylating) subunit CbiE n=1 Tax=Psychrilyobacter piezotolerans TaxID=2293438 RepID=A0ABX9KI36_9FUSO|nr:MULTISPECIES: precorrin-6y C5,15-methyltransferase (decarboxylating) subunit CbiE [Psychrilyobacter]MCS5421653.1 precorrin-6y C5,15-methyltransferase (decarboxylating) subunit CbiE [Psychrilyobacter sp. S5]NDI77221.1 precorrin-6y C5,15-methyltransferase (decarboxylating) subunit CbiE [Psychrilyobacter piezotolerans]RDE63280.1 precorrin-6y C5,15-methyltransferase (decarboxylating) subunit CbiE [Psychrilyobacter sp. S5]REI41822.1 precorrin-6y C5,15-methyltransferase (decarboxylating) subunit C
MEKINILGLGPGNKKYILPITKECIKKSEILIGGRRNIESLGTLAEGKELRYIDRYLDQLSLYMKENRDRRISLIVSGDSGFYSMVPFMKKHFEIKELNIIPGISSMQYMFSAVGYSYEDTFIGSVHGRNCDYLTPVKEGKKAGLLTDNKTTPQVIAQNLLENQIRGTIFVGERLSYDDERITTMSLEEMADLKIIFDINVVIVIPDTPS